MKLVENRPRPIVRREDFGKPFAIHASRVIDPAVFDRIFEIAPDLRHDDEAGDPWQLLARVTSAVIGVATIDRVIEDTDDEDDGTYGLCAADRRWFFGPIGYVLSDVRALATSVPCRGWQGFWTLPGDVERQVMEQL